MKTLIDTIKRDLPLPKDPKVLNRNILDTIKTIEYSIIYIGLGLVKIKTEKLFKNLGYKNMSAYVRYLVEITGKDRSSVYKWLQIGEIYTKFMEELTKAGFNSKDSSTKLPYLERALKINPEKEVYENIVKMSQREFSDYARGIKKIKDEPMENLKQDLIEKEDERGHIITYRGKESVKVYFRQGKEIYDRLILGIKLAYNSMDRKTYVLAAHLDNRKEYVKFEEIIMEAREKMREEMKERKKRRRPSIV